MNESNEPFAKAAAARALGISRGAVARYVARFPAVADARGRVSLPALRLVIEQAKAADGRGFPLGRRRGAEMVTIVTKAEALPIGNKISTARPASRSFDIPPQTVRHDEEGARANWQETQRHRDAVAKAFKKKPDAAAAEHEAAEANRRFWLAEAARLRLCPRELARSIRAGKAQRFDLAKLRLEFPSPGAVRRAFDDWQKALGDGRRRWTAEDWRIVGEDLRPVAEFYARCVAESQAKASRSAMR